MGRTMTGICGLQGGGEGEEWGRIGGVRGAGDGEHGVEDGEHWLRSGGALLGGDRMGQGMDG